MRFAILVLIVLAAVITLGRSASASCWGRYHCSLSEPCEVYLDRAPAPPCDHLPVTYYYTDRGTGCIAHNADGAERCDQRPVVTYDGQWCYVESRASLVDLSCCSVPCPPGTPWCQEF